MAVTYASDGAYERATKHKKAMGEKREVWQKRKALGDRFQAYIKEFGLYVLLFWAADNCLSSLRWD